MTSGQTSVNRVDLWQKDQATITDIPFNHVSSKVRKQQQQQQEQQSTKNNCTAAPLQHILFLCLYKGVETTSSAPSLFFEPPRKQRANKYFYQ